MAAARLVTGEENSRQRGKIVLDHLVKGPGIASSALMKP